MRWLVKDAQPDDSLFFHCQCDCFLNNFNSNLLQILDMAVKPKTRMVTKSMVMTKVYGFFFFHSAAHDGYTFSHLPCTSSNAVLPLPILTSNI